MLVSITIIFVAILFFLSRPKDLAGNYGAYFSQLNRLLQNEGCGYPRLILDMDRLKHNLGLLSTFKKTKKIRLVCKSLPSIPLLKFCMEELGTDLLMVFHIPFLKQVITAFPSANILMGKPVPTNAVRHFCKSMGETSRVKNVTWLVDSIARAKQLNNLGELLGFPLCVAVEVDVGLHRGGLDSSSKFCLLIGYLKNAEHLMMSGLMGYDPHLAKIGLSRLQHFYFEKSKAAYRSFIDDLYQTWPDLKNEELIFNGAGSPTFLMHADDSPLTEVAVGSAIVKPADFELPHLCKYLPAALIATPVLKKEQGPKVPLLEPLSRLWCFWNRNRSFNFFIYGGYWKARPIAPPGLCYNKIYGRSSNQELMTGSKQVELGVDDYIFLHPTQSESVLLQFGSILLFEAGYLSGEWPVLTGDMS